MGGSATRPGWAAEVDLLHIPHRVSGTLVQWDAPPPLWPAAGWRLLTGGGGAGWTKPPGAPAPSMAQGKLLAPTAPQGK